MEVNISGAEIDSILDAFFDRSKTKKLDINKNTRENEELDLVTITSEQKQIITSKFQRAIAIQAFAGTGKTTTLRLLSNAYPDKNFLYLAFNKSAREYAEKKFSSNVSCRTIDSLCYEVSNCKNKSMENFQLGTLKKYIPQLSSYTNAKLGTQVYDLLKNFLNCADESESLESMWKRKHKKSGKELLFIAEQIWQQQQNDPNIKWTCHEFNRKLALTRNNGLDVQNWLEKNFDIILVDECQDLNPVMLAILKKFRKQIVYVGDMYQAIYSFMGNINAFKAISPESSFSLTESFRFGTEIANRANWIMAELYKKPLAPKNFKKFSLITKFVSKDTRIEATSNPSIRGQSAINGKVIDTEDFDFFHSFSSEKNEKWTILSRTNKTLFLRAKSISMEIISHDFKLYGNLKMHWSGKDQFFKKMKQIAKLKDSLKPGQWDTKKQKASEEGDNEMSMIIDLIDEFEDTNAVLNAIEIIEEFITVDEKDAHFILSTVHKAKGLEWNNVFVSSDIAECILKKHRGDNIQEFKEECNIYYVACTRAKLLLVDSSFQKLADTFDPIVV